MIKPDCTLDEAAIIAHCRTNLAKFKVPKAVRFIDNLPRNAAGKVLKRELKLQSVINRNSKHGKQVNDFGRSPCESAFERETGQWQLEKKRTVEVLRRQRCRLRKENRRTLVSRCRGQ